FVMNLIIWISIIITKALVGATTNMLTVRMKEPSVTGASEMTSLLIANYLVSFVIMVMQISVLFKIPSLCEKIINLSLEEIVNFGQTMLSSGLGMAKILGQATLGVTTMGAGLGAAALTGKTLGQLGTGALNSAKGLVGADPTRLGGGGGGSSFS